MYIHGQVMTFSSRSACVL